MPYKFEHEFLHRKFPCDQFFEYPQNVTLVGEPGMCNLFFCVAIIICQNKKWAFHFQYGLICSSQKCFGGKMFVPEKLGGKMFLINSLWRLFFFTRVVLSSMFTPNLGKWSSFFRPYFSVAPPLATWYCWWKKSCYPVGVGSLSHYLQGFIHTRRCRISSINSNTWLTC